MRFYNRIDKSGRTQRVLLRTILALALCAITMYLDLFRIEAFFYDLRVRLKGTEKTSSEIHLILLEEKDKEYIDQLRLTPMRAYLTALKRLVREKPKAIAFLNHFRPSEVQGEWDISEEFVDLVREAESRGIKVFFGTDIDFTGEILPPYPLSLLSHYPAYLHKDGTMFAEDDVSRRALLTILDDPSIHLRLSDLSATNEALKEKAQKIRGSYYYSSGNAWHTVIRYPGDTAKNKALYSSTSFSSLLVDEGQPLTLENKIILLGNLQKDELSDFSNTPYSRNNTKNAKIFTHAAILDTLLKNNGIIIPSQIYDALLTFTLSLLLIYFALRFTPAQGVLCLLSTSILLFLSSLFLLKFAGIWVNLVHPIFAIFCTYYLIVPYRAIIEYKKRWKVQEQHDLLVQVEEMKGNFLSLMSHDLKTPVARIQGLAELILKQGDLTHEQQKELNEILQSTDHLNKFITKILDLTRIESSNIKINTQSKDINKIIEKCIEKLSFQAEKKNIHIVSTLDPLFPIQIDSALIIQVLTNLLDNAIQYSPEGSTIEIFSRELNNSIEVGIKDSGRGMDSKEKKMLFTKFYRGENPAAEQIKGSGLGLYLSKYFIELHRGKIQVESEKGLGSTFTILLPIGVNK